MKDNVTTKRVFLLGWVVALTMACWSCSGRVSGPCASAEDVPPRLRTAVDLKPTSNRFLSVDWSESDREELREWVYSLSMEDGLERALRGEEIPVIAQVSGVREEVRARLNSDDGMWEYSLLGGCEPTFTIALFSMLTGPTSIRLEESVDFALAVGEDCNWVTLNYMADRLLLMAKHDDRVLSIARDRMPSYWVVNTLWREVLGWNQILDQWNWHDEDGGKLSQSEACDILRAWIRRLSKLEEQGNGNMATVEALLDWSQSGESPALLSGIAIPIAESDAIVRLTRAISRNE